MSLLSEWTTDKTNMNTLYDKSSDIHGRQDSGGSTSDADYLESLMNKSRKSQWKCNRLTSNGSGSTSPSSTHLQNYITTAVQYRNQDTSQNWGWADNYTGTRECWIYMTNSYTLSTSFWTDDAGVLFLNGSQIATSTSCTSKSVTLNLKQGLNHILIAFSEGSGGDAGYLATNPFTLSYCKWGYAEFDITK